MRAKIFGNEGVRFVCYSAFINLRHVTFGVFRNPRLFRRLGQK